MIKYLDISLTSPTITQSYRYIEQVDTKVTDSDEDDATSDLLLLLVCVSFTIIGQPRNSVLIRRV